MGAPSTPQSEWRLADLKKEQLGTNQQARVCPVGWGRFLLGGTFISDIFNSRNEPVTQTIEGGRRYGLFGPRQRNEQVVAYEYFGSYAQALCLGPVDTVYAAHSAEEQVYSGTVHRGESHVANLTLALEDAPVGQVDLHWGTPAQPASAHLGLDPAGTHSAYRDVCYMVARQIAFGQTTSPPNITWELGRWPALLDISAHHIGDDAVVPEVIYDVLVNPLYGLRADPAKLDTASFEDAAERVIDEGLGVSPVLDERKTVRRFVSELLQYIRGGLVREGGVIRLRLIRPPAVRIPVAAADLAEQPAPDIESPAARPNQIKLRFRDRTRAYQENHVEYDDMAGREISGGLVSEEVDREWITREDVAARIVQYEGRRRFLPGLRVKLGLGYEYRDILPGDALSLTDDKFAFAGFPLVAGRVETGAAGKGVTVEAHEDHTDLIEDPGQAGDDTYGEAVPLDPDDIDFRICAPSKLLLAGELDGVVIAAARQDPLTEAGRLSFSWDPDGSWSRLIDRLPVWALRLTVNRWQPAGDGLVQLDISIERGHEEALLGSWLADTELQTELYILTGWRAVNTGVDTPGLEGVWALLNYGDPVTPHESEPRRYYVLARSGWFASPVYRAETPEVDGVYPSTVAYMGPRAAFTVLAFNQPNFFRSGANDSGDIARARYLRIQSRLSGRLQPLAEAAQAALVRSGGPWQAGAETTEGQTRVHLGNLYARETAGASVNGSIGPVHTSGTGNDGVLWDYVDADRGAWTAEATTSFGHHYHHDGRLYRRATSGTSANGTTPPAHTSGTESDGEVDWEHIGPYTGAFVTGEDSAVGDHRSANSRLYRRETGGTSANGPYAPDHTAGTAPDGVDWTYLAAAENPAGTYTPGWGPAAALDDSAWGIAETSNPPAPESSPEYDETDFTPPALGGGGWQEP